MLINTAQPNALISITNTIKKNDLGYYKMFLWFYPKKFVVTINDNPIQTGQTMKMPPGIFELTYAYEWQHLWFKRRGKKRIVFASVPGKNDYNIVFNGWDDPERISIHNAKRVSKQEESLLSEGSIPPS